MKHVEEGIVIHRSAYSETSLIVTLLCRKKGLTTFLFQGGKKKQGNILLPLAHIEFSYYLRNDSSMPKLTEAYPKTVFQSLHFHPVKSAVAFFMTEMIRSLLKHGHSEEQLFTVLLEEVRWLDSSHELTNYPLYFLTVLSRECGIAPSVECVRPTVFDLAGGKLTCASPEHLRSLQGKWIHWFESMLSDEKTHFLSLKIIKSERLLCLNAWMDYFQIHFPGLRPLKSIEVIRELLED